MSDNNQSDKGNQHDKSTIGKLAESEFQKSYTHQGTKPDGPAPTARIMSSQLSQPATTMSANGQQAATPETATNTSSQQASTQPVQGSQPEK